MYNIFSRVGLPMGKQRTRCRMVRESKEEWLNSFSQHLCSKEGCNNLADSKSFRGIFVKKNIYISKLLIISIWLFIGMPWDSSGCSSRIVSGTLACPSWWGGKNAFSAWIYREGTCQYGMTAFWLLQVTHQWQEIKTKKVVRFVVIFLRINVHFPFYRETNDDHIFIFASSSNLI